MSALTEASDRIMNWLNQHMPEYAVSFLPGLSSHEISKVIEILDFSFPNELYELYGWRNGNLEEPNSLFFPSFQFMPLAKAVELNQEIENDFLFRELFVFEEQQLFPFMAEEGRYCAISVNYRDASVSPVVYIGKQGSGCYADYVSITSMMLTFAECYETGAYYLDDDGYLKQNAVRVAESLCRYNSQIMAQALLDIRILLTNFEYNFQTSELINNALRTLKRFRSSEATAILREALERYISDERRQNAVIRPLINRALSEIENSTFT